MDEVVLEPDLGTTKKFRDQVFAASLIQDPFPNYVDVTSPLLRDTSTKRSFRPSGPMMADDPLILRRIWYIFKKNLILGQVIH